VAVKIKLKRLGKIREPFYRIVVADARTKRDGRAIEEIGKYHPKLEPSLIQIDSERAQYWLSVGAQPTESVQRLLTITGDWQKFKGLPGAEGTLRTSEPKADKKDRYTELVKESLAAKEAKAAAKPARSSAPKRDAAKKAEAAPAAEAAPVEAAPVEAGPVEAAPPVETVPAEAVAEAPRATAGDGGSEAGLEFNRRRPSQLGVNLRRVEQVATVVAGPVRADSAISRTGAVSVDVKYSVMRLATWPSPTPTATAKKIFQLCT